MARRVSSYSAGSNNCAFGCPTGAKQSALVSYVPRALHYGARLYADVKVDRITRELEAEGVAAFSDSYRTLLACIERKVAAVRKARVATPTR